MTPPLALVSPICLIIEAANRTIAAREETQLRRQGVEVVHDHGAQRGANDHPAVVTDFAQPFPSARTCANEVSDNSCSKPKRRPYNTEWPEVGK